MIGQVKAFEPLFQTKNIELVVPNFVQTLTEDELCQLLPQFDGWIIGDDPATERVLAAGRAGKLRACVKWGIGVDNVDFAACQRLGIPVANTPYMFGNEVADLAVSYVLALARQTFPIDRGVREGRWPKPAGMSLQGKTAAIVGFGDIGMHVAKRLLAFDMALIAYDPYSKFKEQFPTLTFLPFPQQLEMADFIVVTCALTPETKHLINANSLAQAKLGVRVVNVSRGGVIDEVALVAALQIGQVHSAALDVFEQEPLPAQSSLRALDQCIFGTHNGSNTIEAVHRASQRAIELLFGFLGV